MRWMEYRNRLRIQIQTMDSMRLQEQNMQNLIDKFGKVIKFMQWSQVETKQLDQFEKTLCRQLIFTDQEFIKFLSALKIDYQLYNQLIKTYRQIITNVANYTKKKNDQYSASLLTKAASKIILLMKTAAQQIKVACEGVIFLHFVSCNLSNYKKIIKEFQSKRMYEKMESKKFQTSFIIKQKLYSVISIIYIKMTVDSHPILANILESAVQAREIHLKFKFSNNIAKDEHRYFKSKHFQKEYLYESLTIFLANSHVEILWNKINKNPVSSCEIYSLLSLMSKYCKKFTQKGHQKQWFKYLSTNFQMKMLDLKNKLLKILDSLRCEGYIEDDDCEPRSKNFSLNHGIKGSSSIKQNLQRQQSSLKDRLARNFFKQNDDEQSKKNRCKTAVWIRRGNSQKVRDRVLAYTFENAKNALRRIQFQMKANNNKFIKQKKESLGGRLNKKKMRKDIYQKFKGNKKILVDITSNKLDLEISNINQINIWNPFTKLQETKKVILEHIPVHKTDSALAKKKRLGSDPSERFTIIKIMKYIQGVPRLINIRINPKEKTYHIKVETYIDDSNFTFELSLPKSTNIFTDRFQTIWPSIKYLIKKKMMKYRSFKDYEDIFSMWHYQFQDQKNSEMVKQERISDLFGLIHENQLEQISGALGILSKFIDFLFSANKRLFGWDYHFVQMKTQQSEEVCLFYKRIQKYWLIKELRDKRNESLQHIKQSIHLSSQPMSICIGLHILSIKKAIKIRQDNLYNYQIMSVSLMSDKLISSLINNPELQFCIKVERPLDNGKDGKKNNKTNVRIFTSKFQVKDIMKMLKIDRNSFMNQAVQLLTKKTKTKGFHDAIMSLCFDQLPDKNIYEHPSFYYSSFIESGHTPKRNNIFQSIISFSTQVNTSPYINLSNNQIIIIENCLGFNYEQSTEKIDIKDISSLSNCNEDSNFTQFYSMDSNNFILHRANHMKTKFMPISINPTKFTAFNLYRNKRHTHLRFLSQCNGDMKVEMKGSIGSSMNFLIIKEDIIREQLQNGENELCDLFGISKSTIVSKLAILLEGKNCINKLNKHDDQSKRVGLRPIDTQCEYLHIMPFRLYKVYAIFSVKRHVNIENGQHLLEFQIRVRSRRYTLSSFVSIWDFQVTNQSILHQSCLNLLTKNQLNQCCKTNIFAKQKPIKNIKQIIQYCSTIKYDEQMLGSGEWDGNIKNPIPFNIKVFQKYCQKTEQTYHVFYYSPSISINHTFLKQWTNTKQMNQQDFADNQYLILKISNKWHNFEIKKHIHQLINQLHLQNDAKVSLYWLSQQFVQKHMSYK